MPDTKRTIKGREFIHCNCAYGCPCQCNPMTGESIAPASICRVDSLLASVGLIFSRQ